MSGTQVNTKLINEINAALQLFDPIGLDEMSSVALMKRLDTKFILSADRLPALFNAINDDYTALKIGEKLVFGYRTTYYDSAGLETYTDHLRGKSIRHKIRIREYLDTAVNYFEIKKKTNSGVTDKVRIKTTEINDKLDATQQGFASEHLQKINAGGYRKVLTNTFNRITLVNPNDRERVTIDYNLAFDNDQQTQAFANLCIVEIKQPRINRFTPIFRQLKVMGIRPLRISKYCLGVTCLTDVKSNLFKPKLKQIHKTINPYGII